MMLFISALNKRIRTYKNQILTGRNKSKELDILLENAPIGIVLTDKSNQFIYVNTYFQNMLGYTEKELLALNIDAITHTNSLEDSYQAIEGAYSAREPTFLRKQYLHKSGRVVSAHTRIGVVDNKHGVSLYQCTAIMKTDACDSCKNFIVSPALN